MGAKGEGRTGKTKLDGMWTQRGTDGDTRGEVIVRE